jgi:hypothetical protein
LVTYTELKALVENPSYQEQRRECLSALKDGMIDEPIIGLINAFNKLPFCFTLQCCYGHFLYNGQRDPHNMEPLPRMGSISQVEYRIAYVALCMQNSDAGKLLIDDLKKITHIDSENVQFGCAEWFWERQVNSYALQVEPDRFKTEDRCVLYYEEAMKIEKIRNEFFDQLLVLINSSSNTNKQGQGRRNI